MAAAPAAAAQIAPGIVRRHDERVADFIKRQQENGSFPDAYGFYHASTAASLIGAFTAALLHPQSRYHKDRAVFERLQRASSFLTKCQNRDGNIDLLITNFNSPPDTAFVTHHVAAAACLAKRRGENDVLALIEPFLRKAGTALTVGGVHTPNHRWVVCQALAQLNEIFPNPAFVKRIDQWLAEGIDIDADGQYDERSTTVYNAVTNRALVVIAAKLNRPELLDPVRRNLDAMLYLLHPGYEVVTEISHRQDRYQRGTMGRYWFPLQYLAIKDGNGRYATLAKHFEAEFASLAELMEYPELSGPAPAAAPIPEDYEKVFPTLGIARIRRGPVSATVILEGDSRFLALRRGQAVIEGVRFASAFFGKGQFVPDKGGKEGNQYVMTQSLEGPYFQPFDPPRKIAAGEWTRTRPERRRSEICRLTQSAAVRETKNGFQVRIRAAGTDGVPVAVEIGLREGGQLQGCRPVDGVADAWILAEGAAVYRYGSDVIRFGPGAAPHTYTQVRGALPKLPGPCVYLTGYTPFDRTIDFELG